MFKYSALLAILSIAYCNAYVTDSFESNFSNKYIRASKRVLTEVNTFEPIECKTGSNKENCVCPGKCLTYIERPKNTSGCFPNDCWEWDSVNDNCVKSGKSFIPAIILQGIPFTGMFGSGWGNIERWDMFAIQMATVFGGCLLLCIFTCCLMGSSEDCKDCALCSGYCFIFLWAIAITILWIWGIVEIANKPDAPWADWKGDPIMCPLVEH